MFCREYIYIFCFLVGLVSNCATMFLICVISSCEVVTITEEVRGSGTVTTWFCFFSRFVVLEVDEGLLREEDDEE